MDDRQRIIEALKQARERMCRVAAIADANQEIYPRWRIKEVLDHITGWDDALLESVKAHANDQPPPTPATRGMDYYNEQTVQERGPLDLTHTYQEWEVTRQQLIELVEALPEAKVTQPFIFPWGDKGTLEEMLAIFIDHEIEHANEIEQILTANNSE